MNIRLYQFLLFLLTLICACSDSGSSGDNGEQSGGASEAGNAIAIEDKTIAGVSEKGPFINGSAVKIYELSFENLGQTGRTYTGKIASDHGDFRFPNVNLVSQYALLEVDGFYRNEVTGKESAAPITLNALVDFSNRRTANINLLTHLAYERMQFLVDDGISVVEAKKQAEKEILEAFYIKKDSIDNFEDLSIFESGDGNAALLAISILMQGDLPEAKFSSRLANFAYDIEKDGVWNDSLTAADMADWACTADFDKIEDNIKSWNLGSSIPDFKKYVKPFWWNIFGLGACSEKNKGEEKAVTNTFSEYNGLMFVCENSDWIRSWYVINGHLSFHDDAYEIQSINNGATTTLVHNIAGTPLDMSSNCPILHYKYKGDYHYLVAINQSLVINDSIVFNDSWGLAFDNGLVPYARPADDGEGINDWKEVFIRWNSFQLDYEDENFPSKDEVLKNTSTVIWYLEPWTGWQLQVKDFECLTEAEFNKLENLQNNCNTGDIEKGSLTKRLYSCKNNIWNLLQEGSPCAEKLEGKIIEQNPRYLCKNGVMVECLSYGATYTSGQMFCNNDRWTYYECSESNKCERMDENHSFFCNGSEWADTGYEDLCEQQESEQDGMI